MPKRPGEFTPVFNSNEYSATNESSSEGEQVEQYRSENEAPFAPVRPNPVRPSPEKRPRLNLGQLRIHASAPKNAATGRNLVWNGRNYVRNNGTNSEVVESPNNSANAGYEGNSNNGTTRKSRKSRKSRKTKKTRKGRK